MKIQVLQKKKKLLELTNAEQLMDTPKPISTKEEKHLNVISNVIINSIKKSKKGKNMLALTDADPSMNIKKTLFKTDTEKDPNALLMKLIKSTPIPGPEKEKVMLALTNSPHSSNKIINIIEKNLGQKVTKIVPFLARQTSSSSLSPSSNKAVIKDTKNSPRDTTTQPHNTIKRTDLSISQWKKQKRAFLVDQLETHRGVSLTKEQKGGGKNKDGKKIKKLTIPELADMIIKIDKITE